VHHEFVTPVEGVEDDAARARQRTALGLPADAFLVGASGMTEWRKGPDLFVRLAAAFRAQSDRDACFVWIGGSAEGPEWAPLDHEARHLGVDDMVRFVGHQADAAAWYGVLDVFAVPSREDAFPLSALEAATAGVPVVTFATGGLVEFVGPLDPQTVIPYDDVDQFAAVLVALADDDGRRRRLGEATASRARSRHTVAAGAPSLWADLEPLVGGRP
jgi:glycosyltransferase involved in cell wall biosynthesis